MRSTFVCAGTGELETYRTLFSYYGFRFAQVTNFPGVPDTSSFTGHFIHSEVGAQGGSGLSSSTSPLLTNVQHLTRMASLSNLMDVRGVAVGARAGAVQQRASVPRRQCAWPWCSARRGSGGGCCRTGRSSTARDVRCTRFALAPLPRCPPTAPNASGGGGLATLNFRRR